MARKNDNEVSDAGVEAPTSITELKPLIESFLTRLRQIDSELDLLKEDRKKLFEEYQRKVDMKSLKAALQVNKIREKVDHKDTFETYDEILSDL